MLKNILNCKHKIELIIRTDIFVETNSPNVFEYAKVNNFTASYSTSELLDFSNNDVGDVKFDLKTIANLGGLNTNFTSVYKFNNCCDEYFAYVSGIRQYEFVSGGGVRVDYENAVVTSFIKNGKVIPDATIEFVLDSNNQLVTIFEF